MSVTLGNLPARAKDKEGSELDAYFRAARGRGANDSPCCATAAGEMTKRFDTNYHYIVPELHASTQSELNPERLLAQLAEAREQRANAKPAIIEPATYLWLGKTSDRSNRRHLL